MATQPPVDIHASKGGEILVITILFTVLAIIVVLLRAYTRFILLTPSLEETFILLALVFSIGNSISQGLEVQNGMGKHIATLTEVEIVACLKSLYASIILYSLGLTFVKMSILLQYVRLCITPTAARVCYALLAFLAAVGIEAIFTGIFTCTPIDYFWNETIRGGKCANRATLYFANAAMNIATDFALLILPAIILRHLMMPWSQKLVLMVILAFGGLCMTSVKANIYCKWLHRLRPPTSLPLRLNHSKDPTWDKTGTVYWSTVELNIGIVCASMTTLRPLASRIFPGVFSTNRPTPRLPYVLSSGGGNAISLKITQPSSTDPGSTKDIDETSLRNNIELEGSRGDVSLNSYPCEENIDSIRPDTSATAC